MPIVFFLPLPPFISFRSSPYALYFSIDFFLKFRFFGEWNLPFVKLWEMIGCLLIFSSVQSLSCVQLFATPWTAVRQASCPSPTPGVHSDSRPLSRWCHPAISSSVVPLSSCPQSLPASVFSNESTLRMRWPKYWSFSFSIIPSNDHPGLISFSMDWLDLLAVQGTLKSLLQHHTLKASEPLGKT